MAEFRSLPARAYMAVDVEISINSTCRSAVAGSATGADQLHLRCLLSLVLFAPSWIDQDRYTPHLFDNNLVPPSWMR